MNFSRAFLLTGVIYLIVGVLMGMYMGGSGDHSLSPAHAHINLLGFVLMSIFGLVYRAIPEMTNNMFARLHFWLHQIGTLVVVVLLTLLMNGNISEAAMVPLAPLAELAIFVGVLLFAWNLYRSTK